MKDEVFSNVTWGNEWSGTIALANGKTATFEIDFPATDESIPEAARKSLQFIVENEPVIRHNIAASMTELYKDWNDNETIAAEELAQRINLTEVQIWEEGAGVLYWEPDGDFFTDHTIMAYLEANGEISEPQLEG